MKTIRFYPFNEETSMFAAPPKPASKFIPEWYRKQRGVVEEKNNLLFGIIASTIKRCMPIFDYMTSGYIISAPCDIFVDATNPEKLSYSVPPTISHYSEVIFASHAREQYQEYPIDESAYHRDLLRILPLWAIKTPKGYSSIIMNPVHRDPSPIVAFGATVDTDSFLTDGHLSFMVEKNFSGTIKQGTPLVQVIPFKRESWSSKVMLEKDTKNILPKQRLVLRSIFTNSYKINFRFKKDYK
jgi:hypothetical protein